MAYDPPLCLRDVQKKYPHLLNDPTHEWRARTGIELIHREPSTAELKRIWLNWLEMTPEQQEISDRKSVELFGVTNAQHYRKLMSERATVVTRLLGEAGMKNIERTKARIAELCRRLNLELAEVDPSLCELVDVFIKDEIIKRLDNASTELPALEGEVPPVDDAISAIVEKAKSAKPSGVFQKLKVKTEQLTGPAGESEQFWNKELAKEYMDRVGLAKHTECEAKKIWVEFSQPKQGYYGTDYRVLLIISFAGGFYGAAAVDGSYVLSTIQPVKTLDELASAVAKKWFKK